MTENKEFWTIQTHCIENHLLGGDFGQSIPEHLYSRRSGKPSICDSDRGLQTQGVCTSEESMLLN